MIEVIYKEEKSGEENETGFYLPRNIRQVGLIHENYRIYMEDYVYTFLTKAAALTMKQERLGQAAVLTGEIRWKNGVTYVFIRGAVLVEKSEISFDHILIGEDAWEQITEECDTYFPHQEVVGWFLAQQGLQIRITDILTRAHIKYFGGEKVLFLMDSYEHEDAFFRFENNYLVKQSGYYLYYEKNDQMQSYMVARKELLDINAAEKMKDEAVKNFRKIIQEKNENKDDKASVFSLAATACLVLAIGAVSFRFYQNYKDMQSYQVMQEGEPVSSAEVKTIQEDPPMMTAVPKITELPQATKTPEVKTESSQNSQKRNSTKKTKKELILPVSSTPIPAPKEQVANSTSFSYIVRPGDSLFKISLDHYGTIDRIPEICELNGFTEEEVIYPGQIIVLP